MHLRKNAIIIASAILLVIKLRLPLLNADTPFEGDRTPPTVDKYTIVMQLCRMRHTNKRLVALRKFCIINTEYYLIVDIDFLRTEIVPSTEIEFENSLDLTNASVFNEQISKLTSPYFEALKFCLKPPFRLYNHGIRKFSQKCKGILVTMDLCPSHFPLDRRPFKYLQSAFSKFDGPLPIGIAISGMWLENHPCDVRWLIFLEKKKMFNITWINHTYSHPREYKKKPKNLSKGFLLTKGIDVDKEIIKTEIAMIKAGITPSVFVRFPGLVANEMILKKVCALGLIPIGCSGWLAKGEQVTDGSIILIHANGREPRGILLFSKLLSQKKNLIKQIKLNLLDLHECISNTFSSHSYD